MKNKEYSNTHKRAHAKEGKANITKAPSRCDQYSVIPNALANDALSWGAKGLLVYLIAKPCDWSVSVAQLCNHSKKSERPTGRDGTYAIINELIGMGYMDRLQVRVDGVFDGYEYKVRAEATSVVTPYPANPDTGTPDTGSPFTDSPYTGLPSPANPTLQSKENNKVNKRTKKEVIRKDSVPRRRKRKTGFIASAKSVLSKGKSLTEILDEAFTYFWDNMEGLQKCKKIPARKSFAKVIPKGSDPMEFAKMIAEDTQERVKLKQFGFEGTHPTTYLNDQRWTDEKKSSPRSNNRNTGSLDQRFEDKNYGETTLAKRRNRRN